MKSISDFQKRLDNILVALNSGSSANFKLYGRKLSSSIVTKNRFIPVMPTKAIWYRVFDSDKAFWKKGMAMDTGKRVVE